MDSKSIEAAVRRAIETRTRLDMKVRHGLGGLIDVDFEPYIYGDDALQYPFVWGATNDRALMYRLRFDAIVSAKNTQDTFEVDPNAVYSYSVEEEFWEMIG